MLFLTDQDLYFGTLLKLKEWGHDIVTAKDLDLERASDVELLKKARELDRILITRDKDFGALIFLKEELSTGVVLLRMTPSNAEKVHEELKYLLQEHTKKELHHLFCVVEPNRYRIRKL